MAAQALANDGNVFCFAACMHLVTDMATAAIAAELVDVMRGARHRPLIRVDLSAAYIAHLRLHQAHLLLGTGRMLLFGKVVLAEAFVAIGAMAQRLLVAFVTAPRGRDVVASGLLPRRFSCFPVFHCMLFLDGCIDRSNI